MASPRHKVGERRRRDLVVGRGRHRVNRGPDQDQDQGQGQDRDQNLAIARSRKLAIGQGPFPGTARILYLYRRPLDRRGCIHVPAHGRGLGLGLGLVPFTMQVVTFRLVKDVLGRAHVYEYELMIMT